MSKTQEGETGYKCIWGYLRYLGYLETSEGFHWHCFIVYINACCINLGSINQYQYIFRGLAPYISDVQSHVHILLSPFCFTDFLVDFRVCPRAQGAQESQEFSPWHYFVVHFYGMFRTHYKYTLLA